MQDSPSPELLIGQVRQALEEGLAAGFGQKVAANALGIALREMSLAPASSAREIDRLNGLLSSKSGDLPELNRKLVEVIRAGLFPETSGLVAHLIQTTVDKLEVDQPGYPSYRMWKEAP